MSDEPADYVMVAMATIELLDAIATELPTTTRMRLTYDMTIRHIAVSQKPIDQFIAAVQFRLVVPSWFTSWFRALHKLNKNSSSYDRLNKHDPESDSHDSMKARYIQTTGNIICHIALFAYPVDDEVISTC